jgi:glutamate dehydrogenase (NADP+)
MKAAQDYGIMKENPELVSLCIYVDIFFQCFHLASLPESDLSLSVCRSLVHGANISAFLNIAQAMTDQGCV